MMFQLNFRTSHPLPPIIFMSEVGGSSSILLVKMVIITNMMARRTLFFSPKKSGFRPENLFFFIWDPVFWHRGVCTPRRGARFGTFGSIVRKKFNFFLLSMFSILLQHDKLVLQKVWTRCISAYPHQEFCSPSFISSFCRRALSPHSLGSWGHVPLGVQGEREVGADGERKGDGLVLTCQPMAEVHVHGSQRGIHLYPSIYTIYYSSHFLEISQNL